MHTFVSIFHRLIFVLRHRVLFRIPQAAQAIRFLYVCNIGVCTKVYTTEQSRSNTSTSVEKWPLAGNSRISLTWIELTWAQITNSTMSKSVWNNFFRDSLYFLYISERGLNITRPLSKIRGRRGEKKSLYIQTWLTREHWWNWSLWFFSAELQSEE